MPKANITPVAERLWRKVVVKGEDDCWGWQGYRHKTYGHGQIGRGRREEGNTYVHIVAWEEANGPVPDGLFVLHKCDNPPCCNPKHLYVGTQADNVKDMITRRRNRYGVAHPDALLDEEKVRQIRSLSGTVTQQAMAEKFGVSRSAIEHVVVGRNWKHVT